MSRLSERERQPVSTIAEGSDTVSLILPTYNERSSLELLTPRLSRAFGSIPSEVVVVDDNSPDGTADFVEGLRDSGRFRVLRRPRKLGLASAVLDGIAQSAASLVVVMDADGSHPPEVLPDLIRPLCTHEAEMTIGTRHIAGSGPEGLEGHRRTISWGASLLARPLTRVSDPLSGFFAARRTILARAALAPIGYKIALEILVKCRPNPVVEVPYRFAPRLAGESKLGSNEIENYLRHLSRLYAWRLGRASRTR